jgi:hypothetical protein
MPVRPLASARDRVGLVAKLAGHPAHAFLRLVGHVRPTQRVAHRCHREDGGIRHVTNRRSLARSRHGMQLADARGLVRVPRILGGPDTRVSGSASRCWPALRLCTQSELPCGRGAVDPDAFLETSSYGPRSLDAVVRVGRNRPSRARLGQALCLARRWGLGSGGRVFPAPEQPASLADSTRSSADAMSWNHLSARPLDQCELVGTSRRGR